MFCCSVSLPHLIKDIMLGSSPHHLGDEVNHWLFVSMAIRFIQEFGPPLLDPERIHSQEQEQTVQICWPRENIFNTVKYFEVLRRKNIYKYNDTWEITYWGCHGKTNFTIIEAYELALFEETCSSIFHLIKITGSPFISFFICFCPSWKELTQPRSTHVWWLTDLLSTYQSKDWLWKFPCNGDVNITEWVALTAILPRLLQRSKECSGHYSTLYHATSQLIKRCDTHLFFWHNVKKSVHLKFKIMSIICRFHISDVVLPCIFRTKM